MRWMGTPDEPRPGPDQPLSYDEFLVQPPSYRRSARMLVAQRYPYRLRRMSRDMRWLEKVMRRLGFNPEDARWLP